MIPSLLRSRMVGRDACKRRIPHGMLVEISRADLGRTLPFGLIFVMITPFFVFNFVYDYSRDLSDLYCIQYDKERFKTFSRKTLNNDYSLIEIPINCLTHIVQEII